MLFLPRFTFPLTKNLQCHIFFVPLRKLILDRYAVKPKTAALLDIRPQRC